MTGAGSGIGRAVSGRLAADGANVLAVSRQPEGNAAGCLPASGSFRYFQCDLSDSSDLDLKISRILRETGVLDGVILCHGYGDFGSLEEFSASRIQQLVDTNLTSYAMILRLVVPRLKRQRQGDVVVIGSESAMSGGKRGAVYSAAKFGLRGLVQALRKECAPSHVRVSIINPGMVDTPFFDALDFAPGESPDNFLVSADVASAVCSVLEMRPGSVVDEINLSPLKTVIRNKPVRES
ncbi:MAG: SDR family NAD(P)-dependent oxidoreductase [Gammaproteobacteria bacterium]|nr:SDR family NAD(P)-dependent oxidoreductase [Gammaproteobacteria bacterium]